MDGGEKELWHEETKEARGIQAEKPQIESIIHKPYYSVAVKYQQSLRGMFTHW